MKISPINPRTEYARKAQEAARKLGCKFTIYPYSAILDSVNSENYMDKILECCKVTGTELQENLKFILANSKDRFTPTIGVVRYNDKVDFRRLGELVKAKKFPDLEVRDLSQHHANPRKMDIDPYFIGINENAYYRAKCIDDFSFTEGLHLELVPYVFDNEIRKMKKICCPVGKGKADELVVVESDSPLGNGNTIDTFLENVIGNGAVFYADIRKPADTGDRK